MTDRHSSLLPLRDKAMLAVARIHMRWGRDIPTDTQLWDSLQPHKPLMEKYYKIADAVLSATEQPKDAAEQKLEEIMNAVLRYGSKVADRYAAGDLVQRSRTEFLEAESEAYTKVFELVKFALCEKAPEQSKDAADVPLFKHVHAGCGGDFNTEDVCKKCGQHISGCTVDTTRVTVQALYPPSVCTAIAHMEPCAAPNCGRPRCDEWHKSDERGGWHISGGHTFVSGAKSGVR